MNWGATNRKNTFGIKNSAFYYSIVELYIYLSHEGVHGVCRISHEERLGYLAHTGCGTEGTLLGGWRRKRDKGEEQVRKGDGGRREIIISNRHNNCVKSNVKSSQLKSNHGPPGLKGSITDWHFFLALGGEGSKFLLPFPASAKQHIQHTIHEQ